MQYLVEKYTSKYEGTETRKEASDSTQKSIDDWPVIEQLPVQVKFGQKEEQKISVSGIAAN